MFSSAIVAEAETFSGKLKSQSFLFTCKWLRSLDPRWSLYRLLFFYDKESCGPSDIMGRKENSQGLAFLMTTAIIILFWELGTSGVWHFWRLSNAAFLWSLSNGKSFFLSPSLSHLDLVFFNLLFPFPCLWSLHFFPVSPPSLLPSFFFFWSYVYEVSRRNPFVFAPTLLTVAARFEEMTKTCCEEQEKANCFRTKVGIPFIPFTIIYVHSI